MRTRRQRVVPVRQRRQPGLGPAAVAEHAVRRAARPGAGTGRWWSGRTRSGSRPASANDRAGQAVPGGLAGGGAVVDPGRGASGQRPRRRARPAARPARTTRWAGRAGRRPRRRCRAAPASRSMVVTKLRPCAPYSQAVRTTYPASGSSRRTARSPASLLRPYALIGAVGASSGYGRGRRRRRRRSRWRRAAAGRRCAAQAAARCATPSPLTAVAAASSVSAPSTSVQAAALTTTSWPGDRGARPRRVGDVEVGAGRRRSRSTSAARRSTATRSRPSIPPAPVTSHAGHCGRAPPSAAPTRRGCPGTRRRSRRGPSSKVDAAARTRARRGSCVMSSE